MIKSRAHKGSRCPRCLHPGFTHSDSPGDGRPLFRCTGCGHTWTCGQTGEPYKAFSGGFFVPTSPNSAKFASEPQPFSCTRCGKDNCFCFIRPPKKKKRRSK